MNAKIDKVQRYLCNEEHFRYKNISLLFKMYLLKQYFMKNIATEHFSYLH